MKKGAILFLGLILLGGCCTNPTFVKAADEYHAHSSQMIQDYVIDGKPVPTFTDEEKADLKQAQDKFKEAVEAEKQ